MRRRPRQDGRAVEDAHPPAPPALHAAAGDVDLRAALAREDMVAFGLFYDLHSSAAYGLAQHMVGDTAAACAVVEHAFLMLWHDRRRGEDTRGWAQTTLLTHVHAGALATVRRRPLPLDPGRVCGDEAGAALDTLPVNGCPDTVGHGVAHAVGSLPAPQRRALLLAYMGGYRCREIADLLGLSTQSVRQELRRALEALRQAIGEEGA